MSQQHRSQDYKLPQINGRPQSVTQEPNHMQSEMLQSPFQLPSDEEVFLFREQQRQKKQELKATSGEQKIWDKKTASNRTTLKHYKQFETKKDEKYQSKTSYNGKDKKVIQSALEIVKDRQKNRENGIVKEPIVNLLEQKKEMFLVTMAHGIIQNEIIKLKQTSEEKQEALEKSQKMLDDDNENFQKFLEESKQQKADAEMRAEAEIKEKKAREAEIKSLNIKITSLRAEKTRNEEAVANFKEHKDFLDKLAPNQWNEQKEQKRNERIQELQQDYIQKQLKKVQEQEEQEQNERGGRRDRDQQQRQKRNVQEIRQDLEKQFKKLIDSRQCDELEEFEDEYEMYFQTPQQLVELFNDLEERNLFLIQTTQDAEQNLEELKNQYQKTKQEQDNKLKSLIGTKEMLKKNYEVIEINYYYNRMQFNKQEYYG